MASPLIEERAHRLAVQVPRTGWSVDGDPVRLAQVVANLLTNAAKYTDPGGRDRGRRERRGADEIAVSRARQRHRASPRSMLPRVFDLFVQSAAAARPRRGRPRAGADAGAQPGGAARRHASTADSAGPGRGSEFIVHAAARRRRGAAAGLPERARRRAPAPAEAPESRPGSGACWWSTTTRDAAEILARALRRAGPRGRAPRTTASQRAGAGRALPPRRRRCSTSACR